MVEGIEPHNVSNTRGLMLYLQQKAIFHSSYMARKMKPLWVRDLGTLHIDMIRQLRRPYRSFLVGRDNIQAIKTKKPNANLRSRIAAEYQ